METFAFAAAALAATTAFIIGARRIIAEFSAAARRQYNIDQLLHRELTDDGKESIKSQVTRVGAQLDQTQRNVGHVQDALDSHIEDFDLHNSAHRPDE